MTTADKVRDRNASAWLIPNDGSRTNHALRADMRRYDPQDEVDLVIVGAGAGGSVLAQRLARAGWSIVVMDSGPFWDPDADWVSDERGAHTLYWTEPRQIGGADPVPLGSNNSGRGVGGSMIHYAGYTPRFHPSDFRTHTQDGVGADWPITYQDLKPHYEAIEAELPVAGQDWPWGDPHRYPQHAHPVGGNGDIFLRGASALGIEARVGPVAISNGRFGNRPHCIYRGFCLQGCKVNAKASPLITHIPDALAHGAEIRSDSHVTRVLVDDDTGRATGVTYLHAGLEHRQRARAVAVAGYSIETPRLLLLSATARFPDGLGNDHDNLGRYLMVQGAPQTAGRFETEVRMYKAPPPEVSSGPSTRPTHPRRTSAAGPSRPSARCPSPGPNTLPPKDTGAKCSASTCATTSTGPPSAPCASSSPKPTTGSPSPRRRTATGYPSPTSRTPNATTTRHSWLLRSSPWKTSCEPPARKKS